MKKNLTLPITVGLVASILVIIDSFLAPLFSEKGSFTWVAFISWTVFFSATNNERLRAIPGYVIGFLSANLINILTDFFSKGLTFNIINVAVGSVIAVFIVNTLVMFLDKGKKFWIDSISGIFVGIAISFSGAGVSMAMSDYKLLLIILIYGILGLLSGFCCMYFSKKINKVKS